MYRKTLLICCLLTAFSFAKNRIAVLEFKNNGSQNIQHFSGGIPDMLTTTLANSKNISVVERQQIQKIISEMKLGASGLVDPNTAAEIGKVTGANLVVMGSFIDLGRKLRIDAKVVDVETSEIVPGATQNVKASSIEELDVAVDKLAGKLLAKLTGERASLSVQGDPNRKGTLEIVIASFNINGITIDGKVTEPDENGVIKKMVGHGKHLVQIYKGAFKPQKLCESELFVPGGYVVKTKYENKKLTIYATNPLPGTPKTGPLSSKTTTKNAETVTMTAPFMGTVKVQTETSTYTSESDPFSSNTPNKRKPLTTIQLNDLIKTLKSESFEDTRLTLFQSALKNKTMTVAQLERIVVLFSFEESKIKAAKTGYPHCTDQDNFYKISSLFDFGSSKEELAEWVEEQ